MSVEVLKKIDRNQWAPENFPQSIVVLRALMLGDLLCTLPAFRALRHAFPLSKITLVGLPWAKGFVERFHNYFDEFIEFPGYPGLPERKTATEKIPEFLKKVQRRHFDLALQMHGSGSFVNSVLMVFGSKINAGFYEKDYCPDPEWFMSFPQEEHEIFIYLRLMDFLGIPLKGIELEFPLTQQDRKEFDQIHETRELTKTDYVCIHPGARLLTRRWQPERFAQVANRLAQSGLKIVLTGGLDEIGLVDEVCCLIEYPYINLVGKTSLGALGILLKKSKLLISNDTGVSHVAAALKVPSVIIVTGSDPYRWAPLDIDLHKTIFYDVSCRPCSYQSCPFGLACAKLVEVEEVVLKAQALLRTPFKNVS